MYKKLAAILLCFSILSTFPLTASAEEEPLEEPASSQNYEVIIPEGMVMSKKEKTVDIEIFTAGTFDLRNPTPPPVVEITISSDNYDNGWYLVNIEDSDDRIEYTIGTSSGADDVKNHSVVSTEDGLITLYFNLVDADSKFGEFEDFLTFTSELIEENTEKTEETKTETEEIKEETSTEENTNTENPEIPEDKKTENRTDNIENNIESDNEEQTDPENKDSQTDNSSSENKDLTDTPDENLKDNENNSFEKTDEEDNENVENSNTSETNKKNSSS